MVPAACPTRRELTDYALGKLGEERSDVIAAHASTCVSCQERLCACGDSTDSLVAALRRPPTKDPYVDEPTCQVAMALIEAIGREPTHVGVTAAEPGQLGHYQLQAKLGQGGMGTVYKALHTRLRKVVALKVLPAGQMKDEAAAARFDREMQAVGRLNHPNIVAAHDAGEIEGNQYLVMELVDGVDLSTLVGRLGPLPIPEACELIRQAAEGLQHAYEHGLVHRDVKPSNLMLTTDGQVKILDLGLALLSSGYAEGAQELTGTDQMMGTLDYMAPEQGSDSHAVDIRADIYSLGATLYKLLSGRAPYGGKDVTPVKKIMALAMEEPTALAELRPDVPPGLAAVVHQTLDKAPEARPGTPTEVAQALIPWCEGADLARLVTQAKERPGSVETDTPPHSTTSDLSSPGTDTTSRGPVELGDSALEPAALDTGEQKEVQTQPVAARRRVGWKPLAVAAGIVGAFALAIGIALQTPKGVVEIALAEGVEAQDIEVVISQSGRQVQVADARHGWTIRLEDGEYDLDLKGSSDRFQLDRHSVTVHRGEKEIVRITLKRPPTAGGAQPGKPHTPAKPLPSSGPSSKPEPIHITPEPPQFAPGDPLSGMALVARPAPLPGVKSWTIETRHHRGKSEVVAASPDGRLAATAGEDGTIRLWDPRDGRVVKLLIGHGEEVGELAWLPDGRTLAAQDLNGVLWFWDTDSGQMLRRFEGQGYSPPGFAVSPDGATVAIRRRRDKPKVELWSIAPGEFVRRSRAETAWGARLAWSPDGKRLAFASDPHVGLLDPDSGELLHWLSETGRLAKFVWSPDGQLLVLGFDHVVRVFDAESGERLLMTENVGHTVRDMTCSPDSTKVACMGYDQLTIWDIATGENIRRVSVGIGAGSWLPDGTTIFGSAGGDVKSVDASSGTVRWTEKGYRPQCSLLWSPVGNRTAGACSDRTVLIGDLGSDQTLFPLAGSSPVCAWSPDGTILVVHRT